MWDESPGDVSEYSFPSDPKPPEKPAEETAEIANAETTATLVESEENAAAEGRPRDEQGRFLPNEEAAQDGAGEQAETPGLILGKFKSYEDLERSYAQLEQHAGGLRNEVGELRSLVEDRFERLQNQPPQPTFDLDEMIDENPAQAVEIAWRSGNEGALRKALAGWDEIAPGMSSVWVENKQLSAKLARIEQAQQPILQQTQDQQRLNVVAQAYSSLQAQYPDFEEHRQAMGAAAAELAARNGESYVDKMLNQGTAESVAEALEYLYLKARDRQGANLAEVSRELAREHVRDTNRAVSEAIVASATTTSGEAAKPSVADRIAESWDKVEAPFRRDESGWNV